MAIGSILAAVLTASEVAMKVFPSVIKTVEDLKPFAVSLFAQFKGEELTEVELIELERQIDDLAERLQEPLPPAQPGDPDYVAPAAPPPQPVVTSTPKPASPPPPFPSATGAATGTPSSEVKVPDFPPSNPDE